MVETEARAAVEEEEVERDRASRAVRYEPERTQARLALLEEQGILSSKIRERDEIICRELFPAMEDDRRDKYLAGLEDEIAAGQRAVDELAAVVGDPETVCDERGWLPAERWELLLTFFKVRRAVEVRELRARIPTRQAELKALVRRAERAQLRDALRTDEARLASLEAMPPMKAADMCSECANPGPAWPQWAQKVEMVRRAPREMPARPAEPPASAPKPKPIAVIAAGVPVEDVIAKLTAIQTDHPGAQTRQGKRNRWEIWPPGHPPGR